MILRPYMLETLPENRLQYKDYAAWEQKLLSSKEFDIHEKYWEELFSGIYQFLNYHMIEVDHL